MLTNIRRAILIEISMRNTLNNLLELLPMNTENQYQPHALNVHEHKQCLYNTLDRLLFCYVISASVRILLRIYEA
jgi:hypothetical protein